MSPLLTLLDAWRASLPPEGLRDWPMVDHDLERLTGVLRPQERILEYGAGASTVAVAFWRREHPDARHYLAEHDPTWTERVLAFLHRNGLPLPSRLSGPPTLAIVDGGPDFYTRSLVLEGLLASDPRPSLVVDDWQAFCRPTLEGMGAVAWDRAGFLRASAR